MATNRITEGVGKKIVEALKQQSDIEINPVQEDDSYPTPVYEAPESDIISAQQNILAEDSEPSEEIATDQPASFTFANSQHINNTFNSTLMNFQQKENIQAVEDFELPPNV